MPKFIILYCKENKTLSEEIQMLQADTLFLWNHAGQIPEFSGP